MWRRYGDVSYTVLVFGVLCIEVFGLGFLSVAFSRRLSGQAPYSEVEAVLVGAVALTGIALVMLTSYVLAYHIISAVRERQVADRVSSWTEQWIRAIYEEGPLPEAPLPPEAEEAALSLRDLLEGEESDWLAEGLERSGVAASLLRRLGSSRLTVRMDALEGLARARLPSTLGPVIHVMASPRPVLRLMAARAAARTVSSWSGPGVDEAIRSFTGALMTCELPVGAAGEMLVLLERSAPAAVARLLTQSDTPTFLLRAALDSVGRLRLVELAYETGTRVTHRDREVRSAALRALGRLGRVPLRARDAVVIALTDDTEFVRVQAARAAAFVAASDALVALYESLGDLSWWVRRASAESLLHLGRQGISVLVRAARLHPDRFAREMAAQVLLDSGLVIPREIPGLRGTA